MSIEDQSIINPAVTKLEKLNGEPFHGYRSEVWNVVAEVVRQCRASEQGEAVQMPIQQTIPGSEASTQILQELEKASARCREGYPKFAIVHINEAAKLLVS